MGDASMLTGQTCVGLSCFVKDEAEMSACGAPAAPRQCALAQRGYSNDGRIVLEVAHALPEGAEASTFRMQPSKGGLESRSEQRQPHRRCQQPHHHQQTPVDASEEGAGQDRASEDGSSQEVSRGTELSGSGPPLRRKGKRKLPMPDFSVIEDPAELRLQKRLVKNRRSAAASRERKQRELDGLTSNVQGLEADNWGLREALHACESEVRTLRAHVDCLQPAALPAVAPLQRRAGFPAWPPGGLLTEWGPPAGASRQLQPLPLPGGPLLGYQAPRGLWRALPDGADQQGQPLSAVIGPRYGSGSLPRPPTPAAFDDARSPAIHSDSLRSESLRTWGGEAARSVNAAAMQELRTGSASGRLPELGHTVIWDLDGQFLRLAPRAPGIGPAPLAAPEFVPSEADARQGLMARSFSCSALLGGPARAVALPTGGPWPQQLLRERSGLYPPHQQQHVPAHADARYAAFDRLSLHSERSAPTMPLPDLPDPESLDQIDLDGLAWWAATG